MPLPGKEGGMKSALKGVVEIWLEQNSSLNPVILNLHFFIIIIQPLHMSP